MAYRRLFLCAAAVFLAALPTRAEDGLLDTTFSTDGLLLVGWSGNTQRGLGSAVASFPDGSLLVGGQIEVASNHFDLGFVKVNAGGLIVAGWGSLGRRTVAIDADANGDDFVRAIAALPDGSAIAAGSSTKYFPDEEFPSHPPALVRFDTNGDLDPAFGTAGVAIVELPWPTGDFYFQDPVMQPDGKAIYAGYCYDCPLAGDNRSTLILRVGTDGDPDPTFSGDGWIREATGTIGTFSPSKVAIDGAGRIVLFGGVASELGFLRLTSAGGLDTSFGGGDGLVTFPRPVGLSNPYGFAIDGSSGAMYFSYLSTSGANQNFSAVQRFSADGIPDATFGGDGVVELAYQEGVQLESLLVQSDGKILLGGIRLDQETSDREWILYRLTPTGTLDPTFDGNGRRLVDFGQPAGTGEALHAMTLSAGRLVAVGQIKVAGTDRFGIARTTSDLVFRDGFERASAGGWLGN
ncbi:MAG: hypothetical protein ABI639_12515 [Thermoanaerobaculia bacterium]